MDKIKEILLDINPDLDVNRTDLIDGHFLDSLSIISLVAQLEEEFDIIIPAVEIVPKNFNSVEALNAMVERLVEED
ncbi:MAG: acyl carrier protein [Faecalicoccus sp.]|nr:acyl carrier protein [Faecalicoccus sp.]